MNYAPIVFFVYNRPVHTKKTLEALKANYNADKSFLYIYADGPKSSKDLKKVRQTRKIVSKANGFKKVKIIQRDSNIGLAESVIKGVTEVIEKYGSVIVVEDDIVTEPGFLNYMNSALEFYKDKKRIYSVSGYVYPYEKDNNYNYDTFVFPRASTWGWGTWKDRWDNADWTVKRFHEYLYDDDKKTAFSRGGKDLDSMLRMQMDRKINSWGIRWCFSQFENSALTVFPVTSLVNNIGFDGTGEHCGSINRFNVITKNKENDWRFIINLSENDVISKRIRQFFSPNKMTVTINTRERIKRIIKHLIFKFKELPRGRKIDRALFKIKKSMFLGNYSKSIQISFLRYKFRTKNLSSIYCQLNSIWKDRIYSFLPRNNCSVILDCGSNVGVSAAFFSLNYPEAEIKCYEADPDVFQLLEENIKNNKLENINTINAAVWINDNGIRFNQDFIDGGCIELSENPGVKVNSLRLRDELARYEKVSLLKMDIDGAEAAVIEDCKDSLGNVDNILIEYHSKINKPQSLDKILKILTDNNFRYYMENEKLRKQPFINRAYSDAMDMQLNVWAYKIP